MASKVLPALLLLGFLVIVMLSFHPRPLQSAALKIFPPKVNPGANYDLKRYWMVFLERGAHRTNDTALAAQLQEGHLQNIRQLANAGKLLVAGPFGDDGALRGIFIMDCKDSAEVVSLVNQDPAVKAGQLSFSIRPWWTAKNCVFK
ncbi:hypothetical protein HGH93_24730 [Chitinophaga polysaccharea]|uniref:YciI family protein n=1 Tax=Chitinophaga polysaccharea TaxID=1293035 RepID=UPI001455937B|nr:YciI family protein [Chitinophaga polysaccharea]NLR61332.1 hypothetical protein [Chitinophaga polysaccharea]